MLPKQRRGVGVDYSLALRVFQPATHTVNKVQGILDLRGLVYRRFVRDVSPLPDHIGSRSKLRSCSLSHR